MRTPEFRITQWKNPRNGGRRCQVGTFGCLALDDYRNDRASRRTLEGMTVYPRTGSPIASEIRGRRSSLILLCRRMRDLRKLMIAEKEWKERGRKCGVMTSRGEPCKNKGKMEHNGYCRWHIHGW
jgi:hypothetical protein